MFYTFFYYYIIFLFNVLKNIKLCYNYIVMYMKNRKKDIYSKLSLILVIISTIFCCLICYVNILPTKYLVIVLIAILIFTAFNAFSLNLKRLKKKVKKVLSFFSLIAIFVMIIISFYLCRTFGVLSGNGDSKYKLENYSVIVLKNSKYNKLKNLKNTDIGYYKNSIGSDDSKKHLQGKLKSNFVSYDSPNELEDDLLELKLDSVLVEDSILQIMKEESPEFASKIKVIYTFSIKIESESTLKDVNVTEKPFAIYISGIDTYGKINSVARSDVNIVAVVNPDTKQILLISVPRDYYVQLHGTTGYKDKLTHAGIYGIDMSVKTLEDLLDLEINYYLKVNFTSVIDIVDALGGLEVYSEYTFISYSNFSFKEGYNKVNGEQALDFARTRKAFADGDRQRGKNQQALIEAIIRKATNKSIIIKYNSLLSAIDGKYQTNMSTKKITSLIKMQLDDMSPWNITSYSLSGVDARNYTYTYNQSLYVMEPDIESVSEAKQLIQSTLGNKKLDSSYGEYDGQSSTVTEVPVEKDPIIEDNNAQDDIEVEDDIKIEDNNELIEGNNQTEEQPEDSEEEVQDDEVPEEIDDVLMP